MNLEELYDEISKALEEQLKEIQKIIEKADDN